MELNRTDFNYRSFMIDQALLLDACGMPELKHKIESVKSDFDHGSIDTKIEIAEDICKMIFGSNEIDMANYYDVLVGFKYEIPINQFLKLAKPNWLFTERSMPSMRSLTNTEYLLEKNKNKYRNKSSTWASKYDPTVY